MTGRMIRERPIPVRIQIGDAQMIDEIFGEFKNSIAQSLRARQPIRIILKKFRVAVLKHVGAGTGGYHNITGRFFEHANRVFRNGTRLCAQTRVEVRLSAAGLVRRELHVHAQAVENVYDGLSRLRVEGIDEAGHK